MPTIQTKDLTGRALDWAVSKSLGREDPIYRFAPEPGDKDFDPAKDYSDYFYILGPKGAPGPFSPSTEWAKGGQIIDQFNITIIRADDDYEKDADGFTTEVRIPQWFAQCDQWTGHSTTTSYEGEHMDPTFMISEDGGYYGTTSLMAAMRALVASKLGPTVDIPADLLTNQGAS